ncbi:MAG: HAD family hydrolase [Deltaproteobacteria bacterium]|nr:HAD family hydrolase [Deltaproteobacteria bacterium]MBW2598012.1 HAD family hydrolase [Deltaproteobacteria bacterium]MBW2641226.1 HAD family hydrolase [Deltaproteobacteria bacterium]MBW2679941.1 HAD family hydrolase [Deltaproteobacteria bacterium]
MKHIKIVAFDCDGVMFDTTESNTAYYNQILDHFGRPALTAEQFAYCHSHTADRAIANLFPDEEGFRAAQAYRSQMSYIPFLKYMEMEPYLKPLIQRLRPRYKTAIATNRSDTMDRVISEHGLDGYFDLVVCAGDVDHPKPHPDQLIKILKHFGIEPCDSLYVGDSDLDEIAAKAARVPFVAYKNRSLSADFHIQSLKQIAEILGI